MKQSSTLLNSFSQQFSPIESYIREHDDEPLPSSWVMKNLIAYSTALFVVKTRNTGNCTLLLN